MILAISVSKKGQIFWRFDHPFDNLNHIIQIRRFNLAGNNLRCWYTFMSDTTNKYMISTTDLNWDYSKTIENKFMNKKQPRTCSKLRSKAHSNYSLVLGSNHRFSIEKSVLQEQQNQRPLIPNTDCCHRSSLPKVFHYVRCMYALRVLWSVQWRFKFQHLWHHVTSYGITSPYL